jgi:succinate dehydrogenase/fumarate reductase flavoprotein subunit
VSRVIAASALEREDSRGAHYREDHPRTSDLATSSYILVQQQRAALVIRASASVSRGSRRGRPSSRSDHRARLASTSA